MRDIQMYIETTIADKAMSRKLTTNTSLLHEIKETLIQESSGMFLWVYLQLEILWDTCFTDAQIRLALRQLPKDLEETYCRCAQRIVMQDSFALKVLKWVSFATRPLHIEEMREAVAFTTPYDTEWDPEKIPRQEIVAGCCANLVVVDPIDGCVRFAHRSVKQYLESNRGNHIEGYPVDAEQGDLECGEYCLAYLFFSNFNLQVTRAEEMTVTLPSPAALINGVFGSSLIAPFRRTRRGQKGFVPVRIPNIRAKRTLDRTNYKFLDYAVNGWALHTKRIDPGSRPWEQFEQIATNFNDSWNFHPWVSGGRSAQSRLHALFGWAVKEQHEALLHIAMRSKDLMDICDLPLVDEGLPALHIASKLGYYEIVQCLLGFCSVNVLDVQGYAPLHHAVSKGHLDVVRLILCDNDCKVDIRPWKTERTALLLAVSKGDDDIVRVLLAHGAMSEIRGYVESYTLPITPLSVAIRCGYPTVVKTLLEYGANVEYDDGFGTKPLFDATIAGRTDIVEILLKWGANPDHKGRNGSIPLTEAVQCGNEPLVQMLLEKTKNVDSEDDDGRTPLLWAAEYHRVEMMKLLVSKGANCDHIDPTGKTLLVDFIIRRDAKMVRVLLELGANPNTRCSDGIPPWDYACRMELGKIMGLLGRFGAAVPD